jgi:hypothetical protein
MFTPDQLIFVAWKFLDWRTDQQIFTDFHLAQHRDGITRTACGMLIKQSQEQPAYFDVLEPKHLKTCSVCSSRAAEFSKKHFKGRKLMFKRSATKVSKTNKHESDEEMYRAKPVESLEDFAF